MECIHLAEMELNGRPRGEDGHAADLGTLLNIWNSRDSFFGGRVYRAFYGGKASG